MTAKDIISRLIDDKIISGEEAFVLIEAINKPTTIYQPYEIKPYYPWWNNYSISCSDASTSVSKTE